MKFGNIFLFIGSIFIGVMAMEFGIRIIFKDWEVFSSHRFFRTMNVSGFGSLLMGVPSFDGVFAQNDGDFRVTIKINKSGYREIEPVREADGRIWFVGDSFSFGWGVDSLDRFSDRIGRLLKRPVYNLASPAADVCDYQAQIANMPRQLVPAGIVLGLTIENDLANYDCQRGRGPSESDLELKGRFQLPLSSLKHFFMKESALYNVFVVNLKKSPFLVNLLRRLGIIATPHAKTFDAALVDRLIVNKTVQEVLFLNSMLPPETPLIVLIIPSRFDLRDGLHSEFQVRFDLINEFEKHGILVIDPSLEFKKVGFNKIHFVHDGHWSLLGHKIAADVLVSRCGSFGTKCFPSRSWNYKSRHK